MCESVRSSRRDAHGSQKSGGGADERWFFLSLLLLWCSISTLVEPLYVRHISAQPTRFKSTC